MKRSQRKPIVHDRHMSSGGSTPHGVSPRGCNDINPIPELNNVQLKSGESINIQATTDHTPEWPRTMEAEETVDMFCTVETQTSMIDTTSQHQNVDSQNHRKFTVQKPCTSVLGIFERIMFKASDQILNYNKCSLRNLAY